MQLKNWVEHALEVPPVCIATAQLKQAAIKEAKSTVDAQFDETSGGETAETIRTPDEVIVLYSARNPGERDGTVSIQHIASRHSSPFAPFSALANFGAATFKQQV
jgi:hypothetical protein